MVVVVLVVVVVVVLVIVVVPPKSIVLGVATPALSCVVCTMIHVLE